MKMSENERTWKKMKENERKWKNEKKQYKKKEEDLDDEEFFVIEGSGVALTPGVELPGVRPPGVACQLEHSHDVDIHTVKESVKNNNNNNTIWRGSVSIGEEPPLHSGELKHALTQAGGPTQSQLSRPGTPHLLGAPTTEETVKLWY